MELWKRLCEARKLGGPRVLRDREPLELEGDRLTAAYFLAEGVVEEIQTTHRGPSLITQLAVGPTLLGIQEIYSGVTTHQASYRAAGKALVYRIELPSFLALLDAHPAAVNDAVQILSSTLALKARFACTALYDAEARLANLLLAYAELFGQPVENGVRLSLRRSQHDCAMGIGAAERSVNRTLQKWRSEGIISRKAGCYVLHDLRHFERLALELRGCLVRYSPVPKGGPTGTRPPASYLGFRPG